MRRYAVAYLVALVVFSVLDGAWLAAWNNAFYRASLGELLWEKPLLAPALVFYFGYVLGIVILAVAPALRARSWTAAGARGAVLGGVAYGTYGLTNLAVLRGWSTTLAVTDIGWGAVLTAVTAAAAALAVRRMR